MVIAYGLFGVFANISLVLNIVLMLGALSALGATLTLPGIAGIVLTIGIAVDANVLIYERIREELRAGKSNVAAINAGFQRAWGTIIDSHLTQLIAAIVLYFLGSGPVQGFAVTLALGILTSLFTVLHRDARSSSASGTSGAGPRRSRSSISASFPDGTKIPFMKISRYVIAFSIVASVASIGSAYFKGFNLGIDFVGGTAIVIQHQGGPADAGQIRELLDGLELGEVQVQGFGTPEDVLVRVQAQEGGEDADQVAVAKVRDALATENYDDPQHRGGERHGLRRARLEGHHRRARRARRDPDLHLVPLRVAVRARRRHHDDARRHHDHRPVLDHRARVQPHIDRGRADSRRPVAQRNRRRVRPRPREPAKIQEDAAARADRPLDQPDHRAHLADAVHGVPGADPAGVVRRRSHPQLHHRHDLRLLVGMYSSIIVNGPILITFGLKARADEPAGKVVAEARRRRGGLAVAVPGEGLLSLPGRRSTPTAMAASASPSMSHRGSLLCLPTGMHAWDVTTAAELTLESLAPVLAVADQIDVLLIGLGDDIAGHRSRRSARAFRERKVIVEAVATGGAVRTYNILLGEQRAVGAALIAVERAR